MHASHLASRISRSIHEAKQLNSGQATFFQSAHTGGSKDVRGAGCESKDKPGLIILAVGQSLRVQRWSNPQNVYMSCTKGDLRIP
jgi:hypothetical protein